MPSIPSRNVLKTPSPGLHTIHEPFNEMASCFRCTKNIPQLNNLALTLIVLIARPTSEKWAITYPPEFLNISETQNWGIINQQKPTLLGDRTQHCLPQNRHHSQNLHMLSLQHQTNHENNRTHSQLQSDVR
jgi:hypothetical protein